MKKLLLLILLSLSLIGSSYADLRNAEFAYENGNYETAFLEFLSYAREGDSYAQSWIGYMYDQGKGVTQDYNEAFIWFEKAAEQGDSYSQFNLGSMYDEGDGVAEDDKQAFIWYKKAAEQGYDKAQYNLGSMYDNGEGIAQDYKQAFIWYKKAAEQGYDRAQSALGWMYSQGDGVAEDDKQAFIWYKKAAEQGYDKAQYNLGSMYDNGEGIAQDYKQAFIWYKKAAEQGHIDAQFNLAVMYEYGDGVAKDYKQALIWFGKAAEQGDIEAKNAIERIENNNKSLTTIAITNCPKNTELLWNNCYGSFTFPPDSDFAGDTYIGEWKDNELNGQGTYIFGPDSDFAGDVYIGEWKDNKPFGQGIYTYAEGEKYVGEFKDGKYNGRGTYFLTDGTSEEGIWENGEFLYSNKTSTKEVPTSESRELYHAASGSGFAVNSNGYVVTNYHVIEGCGDVKIYHKGREISATVVDSDLYNDLALLKGNFRPTQFYSLSKNKPELLMEIFVAGYPFGYEISTPVKVTKGIVSSLSGIGNNYSNFQYDAAIQPGNSGGPIFNNKGNVIGVAVAKLDYEKIMDSFGTIPENTNFGIKSSVVINFLESNNINLINPNTQTMSNIKLGKIIPDGTYYLSCLMTMAQIERMRENKSLFSNFQ